MLTRKSKYAIRALIALARRSPPGPMLIADLSAQEGIPRKFLEAILLDLRNHGVLVSRKGKGGGYALRRSPREITLGQVIRVVEGPLAPIPCVSRTAYAPCDECTDEATCGVRMVMQEVRDATARILDGATLASAAARVERESRKRGASPRRRPLASSRKSP